MKKKQFKRFIAWGFTVLAVFLIASFSVPVQSFADSVYLNSYYYGGTNWTNFSLELYSSGSWVIVKSVTSTSPTGKVNFTQPLESGLYRIGCRFNSSRVAMVIYSYNGVNLPTSCTGDVPNFETSFTLNASNAYTSGTEMVYYYFSVGSLSTPTPEPTPTPDPTPTPSPTQDPSITTDNEFWGKLNQNANGAWSFITQVFQGLFNNVVFRNLAIYLPLIGLIIGLVVYLFTMGGRND